MLLRKGRSPIFVFSWKSRLPNSRKRPKGLSIRRLRSIASPASEFSTTSIPPPSVIARIWSAKASDRESRT